MDSEKQTPEVERHPAQNELDLEFNSMEPITPKKNIKPEPSLFDKAKGLFAKKEQASPSHQRKEPTLGSTHSQAVSQPPAHATEQAHPESIPQTDKAPSLSASAVNEQTTGGENTMQNESTPSNNLNNTPSHDNAQQNSTQTVTPEATVSSQTTTEGSAVKNWKNPETWAMLQVLPQRHRRLVVVLFAIILLLLLFFWLKPNNHTVQSFEQQNTNAVPIQFQPLDKSQETEATVLDNLTTPQDRNNSPVNVPENTDTLSLPPAQTLTPAGSTNTANNTPVNTQTQDNVARSEKPHAVESVKKGESVKIEAKASTMEKAPVVVNAPAVEKAKSLDTPKVKEKAKVVEHKPIKVERKPAPVVDAEPSKANVKSKTLTVPQGVSLMQVFRNHNLNIADVNAMTKAKGVGNALSSFKAGDKVQISINPQGRVAELRLENGAKFIRQSDGSYLYKK
ncbi:opacity-associated protein OapA [Pasteurella sp. PK-2025]|uniref:opacity-associated protein OapA n=1 Tax=Pasteurella sp. PK-2025 TaxID=3413133 RepID=UPI003C74ED70